MNNDRFNSMRTQGVNTYDATAIEADLLKGKTAYVKGQKIIGTLSPSSEDTSMSFNIYTQLSEPASKDGIWLKTDAAISNKVYFNPDFIKEGRFLTDNFSFMNPSAVVMGQVIVGDYLYSFGANSSTSYLYNLRTKQIVKNLNVPTATYNYTMGAIYYETTNTIFVFWARGSGSNSILCWYAYYIDTDTHSYKEVNHGSQARLDGDYGLIIYNDVLYAIHRMYYRSSYVKWITEINPQTNSAISNYQCGSGDNLSMPTTQGKYIYNVYQGNLYIFDASSKTWSSRIIYNSSGDTAHIYNEYGWCYKSYVAGDYVYLFFNKSTNDYGVYNLTNGELEIRTSNVTINASNWAYNSIVLDSLSGMAYIRSNGLNTLGFQISENTSENYLDNSIIVVQNLSGLRYSKIENSTNLCMGIKDVYVKKENYIEEYETYWGNGEKWILLKNPNNELLE